jgi:hypothetical protein
LPRRNMAGQARDPGMFAQNFFAGITVQHEPNQLFITNLILINMPDEYS